MSKVSQQIQAQRQQGKKIDNLPDGMDANDPLVQQAHEGQGWGAQDQARYDKLKSNNSQQGGEAKQLAQTYRANKQPKYEGVNSSINKNINQDNDINNTITGDNNYAYNRQDNSVRTYGGDTRVFNYKGSGNPELDSPVSAATMAGFYDVDDSPGARAGRLDQEITMAKDHAKGNMDTNFIAQGAIKAASQNSYINPGALDNRIRAREKASFAKSKVNEVNLWGDPDRYNWGKPEDPEEVEKPDFEAIGKSYTDF
jgi:hypothetical protein